MNKREQFLTFVFCGALAQDLTNDTTNAQLIAQMAAGVEERRIPNCPANAAKVFLAYCNGVSRRPHNWMIYEKPDPIPDDRSVAV